MTSRKAAVFLLAAALAAHARAEGEEQVSRGGAAEAAARPQGGAPGAGEEAPAGEAPGAPTPPSPAGGREASSFGESISVTATRAARRTRDVPQAIAVVGSEQLRDKVLFNVKDVVAGTPGVLVETKNGGYDARLLIRGAGLKANYGVREIMVLRDGVPLTDPDSFTRLDWIDLQDVERIEISKGPGNLFSPGSAGGAVQILSRSVFDPGADLAQAAIGTPGSGSLHLRSSGSLGGSAFAVTASLRQQDNDWRAWNRFSTRQVSLKHGWRLGGTGTVESELAYTEADIQLAGAMDAALYQLFRETGEQHATSEPWKHSGRYSRILFLNSKVERPLGPVLVRPRLYYNQWTHLHPVTGVINETASWTRTLGTDLEAEVAHEDAAVAGTLVAGLTFRSQWNDDVRKYEYLDVDHAGGGTTGRILATRSDAKGPLMETQSQRNFLFGLFAQETLRPHPRVLVDLGLRLDRSRLRIRQDQLERYDYASGEYVAGAGASVTEKTFDLPAPKAGISFRASRAVSLYASAARASQVPSDSEVVSNPALTASRATSLEAGVKVRAAALALDLAAYRTTVEDEIVSSIVSGQTVFQNAGETEKRGIEASGSLRLGEDLEAGASWAYSDYVYVAFTERAGGATADRSGNRLPYVPRHQLGLFATWRHPSGLRLRLHSSTWGRYWLDNANTETYRGYAFLTSLGAAWTFGRHEVLLDVENLLDERYAMQVVKDTSGKVTYSAGAPRSVSIGYRFAP